MGFYGGKTKEELYIVREELKRQYEGFKEKGLKLDMSRGKPCEEQLDLSNEILSVVSNKKDCFSKSGFDCRNYGLPDGLAEMKEIFAQLMQVKPQDVFVGGNSSLNMMYNTIAEFYSLGKDGNTPWCKQNNVKFLCPAPGYDRHFGVTEHFGIEMVIVPMTETGPDMDMVESLVSKDDSIKGLWCVPKYSNPTGITFSDETVRRFANLKPAAKDFVLMWDNAYCVHDVTDTPDVLLSIMDECKKAGTEDMLITFASTSKITFAGGGVAALAASEKTLSQLKGSYSMQTIGFDKLNMLRHIKFFTDAAGIKNHMQKHKALLQPRFEVVLSYLKELEELEIAKYTKPNGGYFVSVDVPKNCAKRVVELCKNAGVVLTGAGATFPYGKDPYDKNIRIAPTYPPVEELRSAMELFCLCVKLAALEKL